MTVAQLVALYLRISRSRITPNLPPSSTILKDEGGFSSPAAHASKSHAARWPIPPPTSTAFSGRTLDEMSRILALALLGSIGRSMWNICCPIFAAISGSSRLKFGFSLTNCSITSAAPPIGSMPPPVGMFTAPYVLDINNRFPSD